MAGSEANVYRCLPVVVITGGARGIGRAIGAWFLDHDHRVVLLDRERETLAASVKDLARPDDQLVGIVCDVSDPDQVEKTAADILARFGRVDALVNNAGVAVFKTALETSFAEWRDVMATNLDGVFLCVNAFAPTMVKQGRGAIVNIASISGLRASTLRIAYGTSKAAVIHLSKQYAAELGTLGVRVNVVAPGPVETAMAKQVHTPAIRSDYYDAIPLGRYGEESEMADAVGFLCGPGASYINGQVIAVDGGFDASGVGIPTLRRDLGIERPKA